MSGSSLRVLMISSELEGFAKAGGLADMVRALATELGGLGADVRVVMPRYGSVETGRLRRLEVPLAVPVGGEEEWCTVYSGRIPGSDVAVYLLDHEQLYGREGIYGTRTEPNFRDNLRRFTVLNRGALQLVKRLDWWPDVVHGHDWPAALAPVYLNTLETAGGLAATGSVLTIHNLGYQGVFPAEEFPQVGLDRALVLAAGFESVEGINLLQAGIRAADLLTTVSPTYAREIQTPEHGHRLDGLVRRRAADLFGVLNGMDYETWDPETDPLIEVTYSHRSLGRKARNKVALQAQLGLQVDPKIPLYGMVSRLVEQKGFGALCEPANGSLYTICRDLDLQVVILGTGDAWCEDELRRLAGGLPNLAVRIGFDERLAHLIEAGADFFLMPSAYEPCGLSQMYSLRYGTLPIVRRTGGLADTVVSYDEATGEGTGFVFDDLTPSAIFNTVGWSLWAHHHRAEHLLAMRKRAMKQRFEWSAAADRYLELYRAAIDRRCGSTPRTW